MFKVFDYKCSRCGHQFEAFTSCDDDVDCPKCDGPTKRMLGGKVGGFARPTSSSEHQHEAHEEHVLPGDGSSIVIHPGESREVQAHIANWAACEHGVTAEVSITGPGKDLVRAVARFSRKKKTKAQA